MNCQNMFRLNQRKQNICSVIIGQETVSKFDQINTAKLQLINLLQDRTHANKTSNVPVTSHRGAFA